MKATDQGLRQRIIDTAKAMLFETDELLSITVRQISERAGVWNMQGKARVKF